MSDYGDMCKDLREMRREIAEQARLLGIGGTRESALMAKVDAITRERDEARAALAKFLEWLEKDEAGPQYSMPAGREGPDGEAEWRRWWHGQLDLCAQSLELARKALAATEPKP